MISRHAALAMEIRADWLLMVSPFESANALHVTPGQPFFSDAAKALLAVKTLGKMPIGSEVIATPANLSTLLALSTSLKNDPEAINEALRCIANALLLIEAARMTWVGEQVGGGEACIDFLEV